MFFFCRHNFSQQTKGINAPARLRDCHVCVWEPQVCLACSDTVALNFNSPINVMWRGFRRYPWASFCCASGSPITAVYIAANLQNGVNSADCSGENCRTVKIKWSLYLWRISAWVFICYFLRCETLPGYDECVLYMYSLSGWQIHLCINQAWSDVETCMTLYLVMVQGFKFNLMVLLLIISDKQKA